MCINWAAARHSASELASALRRILAIFSVSVIALSQKLRWTRETRSGYTNYSCLFILMRTLASKKVDDNEVKSVITSVFCEGDGKTIDVSKLKRRKEGDVQQVFDNDIRNIISKHHATKCQAGVYIVGPRRIKNKRLGTSRSFLLCGA